MEIKTRKNNIRLVRRQGKFSANPLFGGSWLYPEDRRYQPDLPGIAKGGHKANRTKLKYRPRATLRELPICGIAPTPKPQLTKSCSICDVERTSSGIRTKPLSLLGALQHRKTQLAPWFTHTRNVCPNLHAAKGSDFAQLIQLCETLPRCPTHQNGQKASLDSRSRCIKLGKRQRCSETI